MAHDNSTCKHCGQAVYSVAGVGRWYHKYTRSQHCMVVRERATPSEAAEVERTGDADLP